MLEEYVIGAVAASLFVGGRALQYSKVSGLYERVAQQEVIADFFSITRPRD